MQISGSTIGATPNAADNMANAIRMIEAHTPKAMSAESSRSCLEKGGYKAVGENRVTSLLLIDSVNRGYIAGNGFEVRQN
jgi:hypothetical protein